MNAGGKAASFSIYVSTHDAMLLHFIVLKAQPKRFKTNNASKETVQTMTRWKVSDIVKV